MSVTRSALRAWTLGNTSELDKNDLILIARYFENETKGYENDVEEDMKEGDDY